MNLSVRSNLNALNISNWEKIFITNFYDKDKSIPSKTATKSKIQLIKEDIDSELERLYNLTIDDFRIDANSPDIIKTFNDEVNAYKDRGEEENAKRLLMNREVTLKNFAANHTQHLYDSYREIVEIIKDEIYEPAFKCLILRETLSKVYKRDKDQSIIKPRNLRETIAGHMVLNKYTMEKIYDKIADSKEIPPSMKFANLYFDALEQYNDKISRTLSISLDNVETYDMGTWIKFDGYATNPDQYFENVKRLTALVQGTPWCTKTLAGQQLNEGDFYVFVDKDNKPHIAVKMMGDELDELRGVLNGDSQELEDEYRDVAISFLENNVEIKNGREWLEKEEWNRRLVEYGKRIERGEFTAQEVEGLLQDLFLREDYRNHSGHENSNIPRLKKVIYKAKKQFADYFQCKEDELCMGDIKICRRSNTYRRNL